MSEGQTGAVPFCAGLAVMLVPTVGGNDIHGPHLGALLPRLIFLVQFALHVHVVVWPGRWAVPPHAHQAGAVVARQAVAVHGQLAVVQLSTSSRKRYGSVDGGAVIIAERTFAVSALHEGQLPAFCSKGCLSRRETLLGAWRVALLVNE